MQVGGAHWLADEIPGVGGAPQEHLEPGKPEPRKEGHIDVEVIYTVHNNSQLQVQWDIDARHALPAALPANLHK